MLRRGHKKIDSATNRKKHTRSGGVNERVASITWRIKNELGGSWLFNYYMFLRHYCREPSDFEDFYDGITALGIMLEFEGPRL